MGATHDRIEEGFERWAGLMCRFRWPVSIAGIGLTLLLASFIPQMRSDNSAESFLLPGDPARIRYDAFRDQFGQDQFLMISVESDELFGLPFLERLRELHAAIESDVPFVDDVTSLIDIRFTRGDADELIVEDLLEDWPATQADLDVLREKVMTTPSYRNVVINDEGTATALMIEPSLSGVEEEDEAALEAFADGAPAEVTNAPSSLGLLRDDELALQVDALTEVVERFDAPEFRLQVSGQGIMNRRSTEYLQRDVTEFVTRAVALMALLLFILFRRWTGVVIPLLVVLSSLAATLGIMVLIGIPSSVSGQVLPVLLLAVGICNAVHFLTLIYQHLAQGEEKPRAIALALRHSGLAVLMTCVTTAGGLLSFTAAEYAQVTNLGKVAPIGIMLAFVYCVTLLPALMAIVPVKANIPASGQALQLFLTSRLIRAGDFATQRPWQVLGATLVALVIAAVGVGRLEFSQFPIKWFPEDDPLRVATEVIDAQFDGTSTLEIVVDTGRVNGLHDPQTMKRIDAAVEFSEAFESSGISAGQSISIVDIVKETHRALNENRAEFYAIPDDRQLLAQELLLFENSGSDDLEDVTDSQFRLARMSLRLPQVDGMVYTAYMADLEVELQEIFGDEIDFELTGMMALFGRTFVVVNTTMARSYILALIIITPMMVLLIGEWRRGLLSMLPNLIPVFMTLGLMGWLDIPLDNSSLLVGCILIGLAVDDTIHFMHKFHHYFEITGNARESVKLTLSTTGVALLFTTLVLSSGFFVMSFAYMDNASQFGQLALFAAIVAFLADLLVGPAILTLFASDSVGRRGTAIPIESSIETAAS